MTLASCASFNGMPKPVLDVGTAVTIPLALQPSAALEETQKLNGDEVGRKALRNRVIAVYVSAMDARYAEFRRALAKETRSGNFGLDVASLGLGGLGTLAKSGANELAAASTFLTGSRASLNKEIYFEKTLPALVAVMDANRIKARGAILTHLQDPTIDYPLELAYADLANYELSASLDNAVQQLTTEASKKVEAEQALYNTLTASCDPTEATGLLWNKINRAAYGLAGHVDDAPAAFASRGKAADLARAAKAFTGDTFSEATTQAEADRQVQAITSAARTICNTETLNQLIATANLKVE